MRQVTDRLTARTKGRGLHEITGEVRQSAVHRRSGQGLLTLFIQQTSAALAIREQTMAAAARRW